MRRLPAIVLLLGAARIASADDEPTAPPEVIEEPVAETPVAETPVAETPVEETGTVTGRIVDGASKEGLPATYIQIKGGADGDQTLASELDGTFTLTLAPGTYELLF